MLAPLPATPFELAEWKQATVQFNYHITVDKMYYSVPYQYIKDTVAKALGVSPSSSYELMHEPGFPVLCIGNRMVVPKEQFIQWVNEHTGGGV